eukprot:7861663-Alexandrium_andersonii.AAC.1
MPEDAEHRPMPPQAAWQHLTMKESVRCSRKCLKRVLYVCRPVFAAAQLVLRFEVQHRGLCAYVV